MSDLDTLARAATRELLDRSSPDVVEPVRRAEADPDPADGGQAGLCRRRRRPLRRWLAADRSRRGTSPRAGDPRPGGAQRCRARRPRLRELGVRPWGIAYGDLNEHPPTDAETEPLLQFSPDGHTLYYSDDQRQLASWDLASGTKTVLAPARARLPDGIGLAGRQHRMFAATATSYSSPRHPCHAFPDPAGGRRRARVVTGRTAAGAQGLRRSVDGGARRLRPGLVHQPRHRAEPATAWPGRPMAAGSRSSTSPRSLGRRDRAVRAMIVRADGEGPGPVHDAGCCAGDDVAPPSVAWSPDGTARRGHQRHWVAHGRLHRAPGRLELEPVHEGYWSWLAWQPIVE